MRKPKNWFKNSKEKAHMNEELKDQEIKEQEETPENQAENKELEETAETVPEGQEEAPEAQEDLNFASIDEALEAIAGLQVALRQKEEELATEKDQYIRLNADFQNFRKRKDRETSEMIRFANQDLLVNLLPILDDFDRTLKVIDKTDKLSAVKDGITLVSNKMRKHFSKIGLEPIESMGKEFDSEIHEAITTIPVEEDDKKGIVVDEVEKGYKLKDRVIRFSKVVVGE